MSDPALEPDPPPPEAQPPTAGSRQAGPQGLSSEVGAKAMRKLRAQQHRTRTVWFGLGMMGLVGWSVAVPTVAGIALGVWLDRRFPGPHSFTLTLLIVGLVLGCINAWRWVSKEDREIAREQERGDE